ncbi:MAG: indole-3-glycerol phosphate synthase TrpC [Bacteroidetes bacterium]|nr:MAG: indole-3-glycerol phosphate synthase TrpC [Bacteroidota bacterium]
MNILNAIVEHKRIEIMKRRKKRSISDLAGYPSYAREVNRLDPGTLVAGTGKPGIIAEFKRKSPSRGLIHPNADPVQVAAGYAKAGAAAISILTDRDFFGGSFLDLQDVRNALPGAVLLRKDFIIDPYQLHEAKAYGADMILLIASLMDAGEVKELALGAGSLGMEVLFEVHTEQDLEKYDPSIRFVGINNRDLKTSRVDTATSLELVKKLPEGVVAVSESGIKEPAEVKRVAQAGFRLFLIGESFMSKPDPGEACREFIASL